MSIKYRNGSGQETIISGLTPGGDLEAGAVATRSGKIDVSPLEVGAYQVVNVAFDTPMPDNTYIINIDCTSGRLNIATFNKTVNGFSIIYLNSSNLVQPQGDSIDWTATKTYTVQHAQQNAESIATLEAMVPTGAGAGNKLTTKSYVDNADNALDTRLDNLEDLIPVGASISNQLATKNETSVDSALSSTSEHAVQNKVVKAALDAKQDTLTFDNVPTAGSNNPVTSTGINTALDTKAGTDKAFMPRGKATETDMDDLLVVGSHIIDPEVTVDNVPEENQWGLVEVFQQGENISTSSVVQVWYGTNGQNYSRIRGGSPLVWSNWKGFGGTQALLLQLHEIVADDPTVIDTDTLVSYIYNNYAIAAPNKNQFYRIWVTAKSTDSRYTACGQYLADVYSGLSGGYTMLFAEFVITRQGGTTLECRLRPWVNDAPNAYISYWNSAGGWSSNHPMNQNGGWYLEDGHTVVKLLTTEDLNNITKNGFYHSGSSVNCTTARHYPCPYAGHLEVQRVSANLIIQKYRPSSNTDYTTTFIRRFYNGAWEAWSSTDYCLFAQVNSQNITASGITVNIPWSTAGRCRELACKFYGFQMVNYWMYGAQTYKAITFLGPNGHRIKLYWANDSATTCTLYLLDSNNNPIAGTIPGLNFYGKLGTAYPSIYM